MKAAMTSLGVSTLHLLSQGRPADFAIEIDNAALIGGQRKRSGLREPGADSAPGLSWPGRKTTGKRHANRIKFTRFDSIFISEAEIATWEVSGLQIPYKGVGTIGTRSISS